MALRNKKKKSITNMHQTLNLTKGLKYILQILSGLILVVRGIALRAGNYLTVGAVS